MRSGEPLDRIAVFGAIRRAAEVARECDRESRKAMHEESWWDHRTLADRGAGARTAIRAAIGSDKT